MRGERCGNSSCNNALPLPTPSPPLTAHRSPLRLWSTPPAPSTRVYFRRRRRRARRRPPCRSTPGGRALVADGRGYIIPVGGAEEKIGDVTILRRFASLCGDERPDRHHPHRLRAERHRRPLRDAVPASLGVGRGPGPSPSTPRADAERPELLEVLDQADGIFLTGGNQLRLSTMIGGTVDGQGAPAAERRGRAHRRHVGGRRVPVRAHDRVRQGGRVARGPRS